VFSVFPVARRKKKWPIQTVCPYVLGVIPEEGDENAERRRFASSDFVITTEHTDDLARPEAPRRE
jgi:hypothetical protein